MDQLEDDPLEFIRVEFSITSFSSSASGNIGLSVEGTTRRQAAADILRALVTSGFEDHATSIVRIWIERCLSQYDQHRNTRDSWKNKDAAIHLLVAVAGKGGTSQVMTTVFILTPF